MMFESSKILIDSKALETNLGFIRAQIGKERRLSSVVKGNAYGHGIEQFVPLAESFGVNHFSVFSADEAERVWSVKKETSDIMIMGAIDEIALQWAIKEGIEVWVFDLDRLKSAIKLSKTVEKPIKIHLELETGMHRTGIEKTELKEVAHLLELNDDWVQLKGLCTHFAGAESITNFYRIQAQIESFDLLTEELLAFGISAEYRHACCSAAMLRFPEMMLDLVRIGILQYGFWPSMETLISFQANTSCLDPLKRLISWESKVMSLKRVAKGDFIGYGTSYLAQRDLLIGIVPVGYSHGFSRSLSNQGRAIVNGTRVPVIGTVNMNCLAIDLTDVENATKDMSVILIGKEGDKEITVAGFSEASNQLNYELLTRLPLNIPRKII